MEKLDVKAEILKLKNTKPSHEEVGEWSKETVPLILDQISADIAQSMDPYLDSLCLPFLLVAMSNFLTTARSINPFLTAAADALRFGMSFSAVVVDQKMGLMDQEESSCKR